MESIHRLSQPIPDSELKRTVPESLNIFQATVSMCSIFLGFIFAGLIQILIGADAFDEPRQLIVHILVWAMLLVLLGLLLAHVVANQVVQYWEIFFPIGWVSHLSAVCFSTGISCVLFGVSELLFFKGDALYGWIVRLAGGCMIPFIITAGRMHGKANYTRDVSSDARG